MAGFSLLAASYFFGFSLWFWGAIATFEYWGWRGFILGVVIFGIGVIPIGFLALALLSQWDVFTELAAVAVSLIVSRLLGIWYLSKSGNLDHERQD